MIRLPVNLTQEREPKPFLICDWDNVLVDTAGDTCEWVGVPRTEIAHITHYDMAAFYPQLRDSNPWSSPEFYAHQTPLPGIERALYALSQVTTIIIATRRPQCVAKTSDDWLAYHGLYYTLVVDADKAALARAFPTLAAVEDEPGQAQDLARYTGWVFLVRRPWNAKLCAYLETIRPGDASYDDLRNIVPVSGLVDVPLELSTRLSRGDTGKFTGTL